MTGLMRVLALTLPLAACAPAEGGVLTDAHADAIVDSAEAFTRDFAAYMSTYPTDSAAVRDAGRFYARNVVYTGDVGGDEPVLVEGLDALAVVSPRPAWLKEFTFEPQRTIVRALAPGAASVNMTYLERWTDTTGTVTIIRGAMHAALMHTSDGWRIISDQASHPGSSERAHTALLARFEGM
jgi:hypothetical protein